MERAPAMRPSLPTSERAVVRRVFGKLCRTPKRQFLKSFSWWKQRFLLRARSRHGRIYRWEALCKASLGFGARRRGPHHSRAELRTFKRRNSHLAQLNLNGATVWFSPSYDPQTGFVYIATRNWSALLQARYALQGRCVLPRRR